MYMYIPVFELVTSTFSTSPDYMYVLHVHVRPLVNLLERERVQLNM